MVMALMVKLLMRLGMCILWHAGVQLPRKRLSPPEFLLESRRDVQWRANRRGADCDKQRRQCLHHQVQRPHHQHLPRSLRHWSQKVCRLRRLRLLLLQYGLCNNPDLCVSLMCSTIDMLDRLHGMQRELYS